MKDALPPYEDLEVKLTAHLLGELGEEECREVEAMLASDKKMQALHKELKTSINLMREAATVGLTSSSVDAQAPTRLSDDRRQKLFESFRHSQVDSSKSSSKVVRGIPWYVPMGIAAALIALLAVSSSMLNTQSTMEKAVAMVEKNVELARASKRETTQLFSNSMIPWGIEPDPESGPEFFDRSNSDRELAEMDFQTVEKRLEESMPQAVDTTEHAVELSLLGDVDVNFDQSADFVSPQNSNARFGRSPATVTRHESIRGRDIGRGSRSSGQQIAPSIQTQSQPVKRSAAKKSSDLSLAGENLVKGFAQKPPSAAPKTAAPAPQRASGFNRAYFADIETESEERFRGEPASGPSKEPASNLASGLSQLKSEASTMSNALNDGIANDEAKATKWFFSNASIDHGVVRAEKEDMELERLNIANETPMPIQNYSEQIASTSEGLVTSLDAEAPRGAESMNGLYKLNKGVAISDESAPVTMSFGLAPEQAEDVSVVAGVLMPSNDTIQENQWSIQNASAGKKIDEIEELQELAEARDFSSQLSRNTRGYGLGTVVDFESRNGSMQDARGGAALDIATYEMAGRYGGGGFGGGGGGLGGGGQGGGGLLGGGLPEDKNLEMASQGGMGGMAGGGGRVADRNANSYGFATPNSSTFDISGDGGGNGAEWVDGYAGAAGNGQLGWSEGAASSHGNLDDNAFGEPLPSLQLAARPDLLASEISAEGEMDSAGSVANASDSFALGVVAPSPSTAPVSESVNGRLTESKMRARFVNPPDGNFDSAQVIREAAIASGTERGLSREMQLSQRAKEIAVDDVSQSIQTFGAELDAKSTQGVNVLGRRQMAIKPQGQDEDGDALLYARAENKKKSLPDLSEPSDSPEPLTGLPVDELKQASVREEIREKYAKVTPAGNVEHRPEQDAKVEPTSTFSLNVSDVSFKLAQAALDQGQLPDPESIRSEQFLNAFDYRDPAPFSDQEVGFNYEMARHPFAHHRDVLRLSLKTASTGRTEGRPMSLTLLLDNSGSMERNDRREILRQALDVLSQTLSEQDKISVVSFARTARLWVDGVPGGTPGTVLEPVQNLMPQGGTNLEEALNVAYEVAQNHYLQEGLNRVILLTDGAANLGNVDPETLKEKVEAERRRGVAFDCFGIGWDGLNDPMLESLSRNGDGRYAFLNDPTVAGHEFANRLAGALNVAASDVKVQVEFNADRVGNWRQIGYAKHQLTKEQFRDNTVDAAEIAAAEAGNALYVLEPKENGSGPLGVVRVRFRVPHTNQYHEKEWTVPYRSSIPDASESSPSMKLALTSSLFAEWMNGNPHAGNISISELKGLLGGVPEVYGQDERPHTLERMLEQANRISGL